MLVKVKTEVHLGSRRLRCLKRSLGRMLESVTPGQDLELSVMMVDAEAMRQLNLEYLGRNEPTDVMAFPQAAPGEIGWDTHGGGRRALLGDIVICVPVARQQARERGETLARELELLAAHGLLHLVGYGDRTPEEKRKMYAMETELLGRTIIRDEY